MGFKSPWIIAGLFLLGMLLGGAVQSIRPSPEKTEDAKTREIGRFQHIPAPPEEKAVYILDTMTGDMVITYYTLKGDYRAFKLENREGKIYELNKGR